MFRVEVEVLVVVLVKLGIEPSADIVLFFVPLQCVPIVIIGDPREIEQRNGQANQYHIRKAAEREQGWGIPLQTRWSMGCKIFARLPALLLRLSAVVPLGAHLGC